MKKLASVFLVFASLLLAACSAQATTPLPTETPQALPPIAALTTQLQLFHRNPANSPTESGIFGLVFLLS